MITASQIRNGMVIVYNGEPHKVLDYKYTMHGRQSNMIPCKLRSLVSGATEQCRFSSGDKIEKAFISEEEMEFLYKEGTTYWFMNNSDYEQISIEEQDLGDAVGYLMPNTECKIQMYEGNPVGISLPQYMDFEVISTEPVIKGATVSGNVTKPAEIETGLTIQVPMFVEKGNLITVNTTNGEYAGRPAKK